MPLLPAYRTSATSRHARANQRLNDTYLRLREWVMEHAKSYLSGANATKGRRILKVTVALTSAVALTLPKPLSSRYGQNPFLLGTVAIYLFPIRTTGGQIISSTIGMAGVLFGLAYANLILWISNYMRHDDEFGISIGRHVFLWLSLVVGAFMCGYLRSKITRSYLGINFFMVVNMFALIRGINRFEPYFHDFFYAMVIGMTVSLVVSFLLWPEDHSKSLRQHTLHCLQEAKSLITHCRSAVTNGAIEELDLKPLMSAEKQLGESLHEANYELCFSRVDPEGIRPLYRCLTRLIILGRVFNATVRRRRRMGYMASEPGPAILTGPRLDLNNDQTTQLVGDTFDLAIQVLIRAESRVHALYSGKDSPDMEHSKLAESRHALESLIETNVHRRKLHGYQDLSHASFVDQINNNIQELLNVVSDMAQIISKVPSGRYRPILPKFLKSKPAEKQESAGHTLRKEASTARSDAFLTGRSFVTTADEYLAFDQYPDGWGKIMVWLTLRFMDIQRSRHVKYAIKFSVAMGILSMPAYISDWHHWYEGLRCQLAMISAMVAMETTQGLTFRTAFMKLIGALLGGLMAFAVVEAAQGSIGISIGLTAIVGCVIGHLLVHHRLSKSGTVCGLAYNLILGVATIFPDSHVSATFGKRLGTLPVGLAVATLVHLIVYPYKSRSQLVRTLSSALDWLHHLIFAIEASAEFPHLERSFDTIVRKTSSRLRLAKALLPSTKYEVSMAGEWPLEKFEQILDKIWDIVDVIVGDTSKEPELSINLDAGRACLKLRAKLMASVCNDLLVVSHTLRARLQMPRHESSSIEIFDEFLQSLYTRITTQTAGDLQCPDEVPDIYDDVGRLADLVSEVSILRTHVDELNQDIQSSRLGRISRRPSVVYDTTTSRAPSSQGFARFPSVARSVTPTPMQNREVAFEDVQRATERKVVVKGPRVVDEGAGRSASV